MELENIMTRKVWKEKNIPDLSKKVIIVTGGNSGLGYESCKMFSKKGAIVIMASRNLDKCEEAKSTILKEVPHAIIETMVLDLGDLQSVKRFVNEFRSKYRTLDVLLNNAGVMFTPQMKTTDGFEYQNGINHLGHFALTAQLFDMLKSTPQSRIVNVSSMGHRMGSMDFENYMFEKEGSYSPASSYGRSKLSNLLFTYELDKKLKEVSSPVKVLVAHPGASNTNLYRNVKGKWWYWLIYPFFLITTQGAYKGALPQVRACVDLDVKSGEYYGPRGIAEVKGYPKLVQSNEASHNMKDAETLWTLSEELTNVLFQV